MEAAFPAAGQMPRQTASPLFKAFDQNLSNAVFAHGEQQGYHRLKTQCPGPGEVSPGPPDKPLRRLPQFPNQRMQDLPQYTWCVFHVHLPPEKQFHFSGLCRTFFCICQAFLRFSLIHFTCDFNLMTLLTMRHIYSHKPYFVLRIVSHHRSVDKGASAAESRCSTGSILCLRRNGSFIQSKVWPAAH